MRSQSILGPDHRIELGPMKRHRIQLPIDRKNRIPLCCIDRLCAMNFRQFESVVERQCKLIDSVNPFGIDRELTFGIDCEALQTGSQYILRALSTDFAIFVDLIP